MRLRVLFMGQIRKLLLKNRILLIIQYLFTQQRRRRMNSWLIPIVIFMIVQQRDYVSLPFMVRWGVRIWLTLVSLIVSLKESRLRFLIMVILKMTFIETLHILMILSKELND